MRSTPISQSPKKISKSIPNTPKIILANNNSNWVNAPEAKNFLPLLKTTVFQQIPQSTNLLAKILEKLAANLTPAMNPTPFITRT